MCDKCKPSKELQEKLTAAGYEGDFCLTELLERLPIIHAVSKGKDKYYCWNEMKSKSEGHLASGATAADALAKMWLWLKENKYL